MKEKSKGKQILYGVVVALILVFMIRGGGLAALGPMLKFLIPAGVVGYFGYRAYKRFILPFKQVAEQIQRAQEQAQNMQRHGDTEGPVIEICPECHHQKDAAGRCKC